MYRVQKAHWKNIGFAVVISLIAALVVYANIIGRSFSSDDVSVQNAVHSLGQVGQHTILQGYNTDILKIPVYLIFNLFIIPGRTALILEAILFNLTMVVLLAVYWQKIVAESRYRWLAFVWLISSGIFWLTRTINLNDRNFDLAIMLLASLWVIKRADWLISLKKRAIPYLIAASLISGLLIYNDPYYLFFILIPLFVSLGIFYIRKSMVIIATLLAFLGSIITWQLIKISLQHFGLFFSKVSQTNAITSGLTSLKDLPLKTIHIFNGYLYLIGASPTYLKTGHYIAPVVLFNLAVIAAAIVGLYIIVRHRLYSLTNIWVIVTILITFGYLILTSAPILDTYHYLIILMPITALLVLVTISRLKASKGKYKAVLAVIVVSVSLNVIHGISYLNSQGRMTKPNAIDYQLISVMRKNGINKVYGNYWVANISYYLSDYKANVLPTTCVNGTTYVQPLLLDTTRLKSVSKEVGILVSPKLVIPTQSPYPQSPSCTLSAAVGQFGEPERIFYMSSGSDLLVYDHNPDIETSYNY